MKIAIPELALVLLVGPSGSGKSSFGRKHFLPTEVISSDFCRGLVADNENDQSATGDAFDLLHTIVRKRLARGRFTVVDATNVQPEARKSLIALAKENGVAGYPGSGANRWPAVHTLDLVRLFRLALEKAPAGTQWHGVGDSGIPMREIMQSIGDHLGVPTESIPSDRMTSYYGPFLASLIAEDIPSSSLITRHVLDWQPTHPGLLADFSKGHYFPAGP